jgi:hypothetical protein
MKENMMAGIRKNGMPSIEPHQKKNSKISLILIEYVLDTHCISWGKCF